MTTGLDCRTPTERTHSRQFICNHGNIPFGLANREDPVKEREGGYIRGGYISCVVHVLVIRGKDNVRERREEETRRGERTRRREENR